MEYKCDHCSNIKPKTEYYKNNLSKCKECTKYESSINRVNKNINFKRLEDISTDLNTNNILLNNILISIKEIREEMNLIKNNINMKNKNLNEDIDKLNIFNIKNDEEYEKI